jgi:predicted PurR-regulated permease PerM
MQTQSQFPRWLSIGLAFPLVILNGWVLLQVVQYFQPLINIFVAAILLAFVLDYPIQFFQSRGIKRNLAIGGVLLLTIIIIAVLGIILVPLIIEQINELVTYLPSWIDSGTEQLQALQSWAANQKLPTELSNLPTQLLDRVSSQLQAVTGKVLSFAVDTIGTLVNVVLTVVLTIYLVLSGEKLWDGIFLWFPPHISVQVRQLLREDFHNYFIGQAIVGGILSVALILAFLALRVPLALLFGLTIGLFSLFPFGTGIGIVIVASLVGLQNIWLGVEVLAIAFSIDQVNSNLIAPRLIGGLTGLNSVWVVVSLLLGTKLAGLLGLIVAIPLASFIKSTADSWRIGRFQVESAENNIKLEENPDVLIEH